MMPADLGSSVQSARHELLDTNPLWTFVGEDSTEVDTGAAIGAGTNAVAVHDRLLVAHGTLVQEDVVAPRPQESDPSLLVRFDKARIRILVQFDMSMSHRERYVCARRQENGREQNYEEVGPSSGWSEHKMIAPGSLADGRDYRSLTHCSIPGTFVPLQIRCGGIRDR